MNNRILLFLLLPIISFSQVTVGSAYATTSPPANGLIVQGNTGIGVTTPVAKLHVYNSINTGIPASGSFIAPTFRVQATNGAIDFHNDVSSPWGNSIQSKDISVNTALPLLLQPMGGNIGVNTNNPLYNLDVNGTAKIGTTPTITTATKVLVKDPTTGQISEQTFTGGGKYVLNFEGDAYYYLTNWRTLGTTRNVWSTVAGSNLGNPTYNTSLNRGFIISSAGTLTKIKMLNRFTAAVGTSQNITTSFSVIRAGAILNIVFINQSTGVLTIGQTLVATSTPNFALQENDILVWASTNSSTLNLISESNIVFEIQ